MKLCINCKYYDNGNCRAPQAMIIDPVTGEQTTRPIETCKDHRTGWGVDWLGCRINGYCGAGGRWFKPKTNEEVR